MNIIKTSMRIILTTKYNRKTAKQEVKNGDGSIGTIELEHFPGRTLNVEQTVQGIYCEELGHGYIEQNQYHFRSIMGSKRECERYFEKFHVLKWEKEIGEEL